MRGERGGHHHVVQAISAARRQRIRTGPHNSKLSPATSTVTREPLPLEVLLPTVLAFTTWSATLANGAKTLTTECLMCASGVAEPGMAFTPVTFGCPRADLMSSILVIAL